MASSGSTPNDAVIITGSDKPTGSVAPLIPSSILTPGSSASSVAAATTTTPTAASLLRRRTSSIVKANSDEAKEGYYSPHVSVRVSGYDEQKSYNPHISSAYQTRQQELSLRINSLTAGRKTVGGNVVALQNPESVAADLSKTDNGALYTTVHFLPPNELAAMVKTDVSKGLSSSLVEVNRQEYGDNVVSPAAEASFILIFAKQLVAGFNALLWIATIVIFLSWQPLGSLNGLLPQTVNVAVSALLLVVIFISAVFSVYMEIRAINIVKGFASIAPGKVRVTRGGADMEIPASEVVVGDIVHVQLGDRVPADIRLLEVHNLQVDNSALTGESEAITCSTRCTSLNFMESANMIFCGTAVPQGKAKGIVVATGNQTMIGQINSLTQQDDNLETSLHKEIFNFVFIVACAAITTGSVALIIWGAWLYQQHPGFMPPAGIILNVISLIIAYVPEGLPVSVTVTLTIIAQRMQAQNVLIRNLAIIETFNSVSLIATDKTGTLTLNQMSITQILWGLTRSYAVPMKLDPEKKDRGAAAIWADLGAIASDNGFKSLLLGGALCNASSLQTNEDGTVRVLGDAADIALHQLIDQKFSLDTKNIRSQQQRLNALPFNSKNKFMITADIISHKPLQEDQPASVILTTANDSAQVLVYMKGAPEIVLERCSNIAIEATGNDFATTELTDELRARIMSRQETLGRSGLRVIAMAQLKTSETIFKKGSSNDIEGFPSNGYTFLGMFGLVDPPRDQVAESIVKAHLAGIRVAMVTGDHKSTAYAIAKEVNIVPKNINDDQVYTVQLASDQLGRANIQMMQGDKPTSAHVLGQAVKVETAEATAKKTLIKEVAPRKVPNESAAVITGQDINVFDDFMWDWVFDHRYLVFARTTPEQKLKIVSEAQKRHEVVAVTGDGVNDAPALKQADLGVAMQTGADVAREAAAMVLMENNFASIVTAIETGRVVSDNLKKVCLYLMVGGTYCEMWAVMTNVFFGIPLPLASFEMIMVSIGTDILDSLALVQEKPESAIMLRPPIDRRTARLVDWRVVVQAYAILGTIITFGAFLCEFWYLQDVAGLHPDCIFFAFQYEVADPYTCSADPSISISAADQVIYNQTGQSIYFVALIIMNWFQMLSTRTRYASFFQHNPFYGRGQNLWLFVSMAVGIGIAVFVTNVEWFNVTFGTRPAPIKYVAPAIGFGALLFCFDEFRKWHVRNYPTGFWAKIAW